jgi:hypothetical protein
MTINYNPNLPQGDAPTEELVVSKLGGLILADPEAFDEQPSDSNVGASWNTDAWNSIFDATDADEEEV